jgi:nucleoside-diphosphate-sugar epimerase
MMYMPDALAATLDLMDAPAQTLTVRTSYNVTATSFSAEALARALAARRPGFSVTYEPDARQAIADAWCDSVDDTVARADWGWQPRFDLDAMIDDMLAHLSPAANATTDSADVPVENA